MKQAETQRIAADGAVTARHPRDLPMAPGPRPRSRPRHRRVAGVPAPLGPRRPRRPGQQEAQERRVADHRASPVRASRWNSTASPSGATTTSPSSSSPRTSPSYVYLPRLKDSRVLVGAVRDGAGLLTWEEESFAFADGFDEATGRYRGLRGGQHVSLVDPDSPGLLVKGAVARAQLDADSVKVETGVGSGAQVAAGGGSASTLIGQGTGLRLGAAPPGPTPPEDARPRRFHGTVTLDATRLGRDAGRVAEEVIAHLTGIVGARVTVTLEVEAEIPSGASDQVVRTVTENSRTLKFTSQGFEAD